MQILYPDGDNPAFMRLYEKQHKRPGKQDDSGRNDNTKNNCYCDGGTDSLADAVGFPGAEILGDKRRKGIPEILYGHIGKRIDFYSRGKGCHDGGPEAVN